MNYMCLNWESSAMFFATSKAKPTETHHLWGSRGWWCTALWGCSGPAPHPGPAAARWCPDSSTSVRSDSSWSALPQVRPARLSREGTAGWRSWRRCASLLRHTRATSELSECKEDKGQKENVVCTFYSKANDMFHMKSKLFLFDPTLGWKN